MSSSTLTLLVPSEVLTRVQSIFTARGRRAAPPPGTLGAVKLIYKPIGIILGIISGLIGKRIFNFVWSRIDDEDPPKPTTEVATWTKLLTAAAMQGMIFRVTRTVVDRYGAKGWSYLTGIWPGERRPEPKP